MKLVAAGSIVALLVGFAFVPTAPVPAYSRLEASANPGLVQWYDLSSAKSGLRIAVEGRLKWLGVTD